MYAIRSYYETLEELIIEQAIAREALRLAFEQHKQLAVGLKGVQQERTISRITSYNVCYTKLLRNQSQNHLLATRPRTADG